MFNINIRKTIGHTVNNELANTLVAGSVVGKWKANDKDGIVIVMPEDSLEVLKDCFEAINTTYIDDKEMYYKQAEEELNAAMKGFAKISDDQMVETYGALLVHIYMLSMGGRLKNWDQYSGVWQLRLDRVGAI